MLHFESVCFHLCICRKQGFLNSQDLLTIYLINWHEVYGVVYGVLLEFSSMYGQCTFILTVEHRCARFWIPAPRTSLVLRSHLILEGALAYDMSDCAITELSRYQSSTLASEKTQRIQVHTGLQYHLQKERRSF